MNSISNFIIRKCKFVKRNWPSIFGIVIWYLLITICLNKPDKANWPIAIITTTILVYILTYNTKEEGKYQDIKQNLKLLYEEYQRNVDLSIIIDQQTRYERIKELPFSKYSTKFMEKIIERCMIEEKNLNYRIKSELNRLWWFNKVWLILAREILLENKKLEKKIRNYLKYNDEEIYRKLKETNDLLKTYFEKKYNEELKI